MTGVPPGVAEAFAVELVGRVLVGAGVDGKAGRVVLQIAGEDLVHLEGNLHEPPAGPAVSEQPVCRYALGRQLVLAGAGVDLRGDVAVVLAVIQLGARWAVGPIGGRRLGGPVRLDRPAR